MISFSKLGQHGRLGNQLFQYAFLRTKANHLGVKYACPKWIGDNIFELNESNRIVTSRRQHRYYFKEPISITGYDRNTESIRDETEVLGYFQSSRYFDNSPKNWFVFKDTYVDHSRFDGTTALHIRLGDYKQLTHVFNPLNKSYYIEALALTQTSRVMVFSDSPQESRKLLEGIHGYDFNFVENNPPHIDLQWMSLCQNNIIANSSFSWWGAWLNRKKEKKVIFPLRWFSDAAKKPSHDFGLDGWIGL